MMKTGIRFPALSGGQAQSYTSNDIENFKGEEIFDNLVREIIQNSLDAVNKNSEGAVKVVFQMKYLKKTLYQVFDEYSLCIKGCRKYWGEEADKRLSRFLNEAENTLNKEEIPVLVASDYNTRGLCGSRGGGKKSPWQALINEDGVSAKESTVSGGSFGIGKNASFACSSLSLVFYNTYAIDGEKAFEGVARLATLFDKNNKATQRIGKYQKYDEELEKFEPVYGNDECSIRDLFSRSEYGTDVIVAGFNQEADWEKYAVKAVIKNFFVAVKEHKLVVEIFGDNEKYVVNEETLSDLITAFANEKDIQSAIQLYKAFVYPDKHVYLSIAEENDAELYIKADPTFGRNIANFRNTGMLVGQKSKRLFQHYAAVLVIRGEELSEILKETEPPRHNRWDHKLIEGEENKELRKRAKQLIEKIEVEVLEAIKSQFEVAAGESIDAEGVGEYLPDNTDDLGDGGVGDDILRPKIKIGKIKRTTAPKALDYVQGQKGIGTKTTGEVHNETINPDGPLVDEITPSVNDDGDGTEGVKKGQGKKKVQVPVMKLQRAFPLDSHNGVYKVVMLPAKEYENLYISVKSIGEDGKTDDLNCINAQINGNTVGVAGDKVGPFTMKEGEMSDLILNIDSKEKLTLNLTIREGE